MKTTILAVTLFFLTSPALINAAIMYGDFDGTTVMYLDVTESNATDEQRFGPPENFGDQLDFNPTNFRAQSDGPAVIVDSQLNMTIMSKTTATPITDILIDEAGDFTLSGLDPAQAMATVGTNVQFTVTHVNGNPITDIAPELCVGDGQLVYTPNANGEFSLPDDQGSAVPWRGNLDYDVAALLASCGVEGNATKVDVVLDNTLTATAADGGAAFIAKKDFRGLTITIPEPSSLGLAAGMLAFLGVFIRRR